MGGDGGDGHEEGGEHGSILGENRREGTVMRILMLMVALGLALAQAPRHEDTEF